MTTSTSLASLAAGTGSNGTGWEQVEVTRRSEGGTLAPPPDLGTPPVMYRESSVRPGCRLPELSPCVIRASGIAELVQPLPSCPPRPLRHYGGLKFLGQSRRGRSQSDPQKAHSN